MGRRTGGAEEALLTTGSAGARVGLLGGTFNPPHLGHLVCAQEAIVQLELDRVLLMPAHHPPHKVVEADPGVAHRVAMCEAAVAPDPRLDVCLAEVRRGGASFTVDTLRALHADAPGDELTFIVGGDMAHSLPTWREPEAVLGLATLAVAGREELARPAIVEQLAGLRGVPQRLRFFDMPRLDISSSLIRRRLAAGLPVRYLVPEGVVAYIAREGLYTPSAARRRRRSRMSEPRRTAAPREEPALAPPRLAELVGRYAADKKAIDIVALDLRGVLGYTDYFVICSGNTERQTKAIHDGIHLGLKKDHGLLPRRVEGINEARWILMDYLDVIVHVFTPEARSFYRLEQLWGEAPRRAVGE